MNKVQKLSRTLKYAFYIGAFFNIITPFIIYINETVIRLIINIIVTTKVTYSDLLPVSLERYLSFSLGHKTLIALSTLPANIFYSLALLFAGRLLSLYAKGEYFQKKPPNDLGKSESFSFSQ